MSVPSTAQDWIAHKGKAAKLGLTLRQTILNMLPDIRETLDLKAAMVSYGISEAYEDTVVIIRSDGPFWSLGFYRGRELPDPKGLLTGNGRLHAAVIIAGRADVESEGLKDLIMAAYEAALRRKGQRK
jgi:hypothetical protein